MTVQNFRLFEVNSEACREIDGRSQKHWQEWWAAEVFALLIQAKLSVGLTWTTYINTQCREDAACICQVLKFTQHPAQLSKRFAFTLMQKNMLLVFGGLANWTSGTGREKLYTIRMWTVCSTKYAVLRLSDEAASNNICVIFVGCSRKIDIITDLHHSTESIFTHLYESVKTDGDNFPLVIGFVLENMTWIVCCCWQSMQKP